MKIIFHYVTQTFLSVLQVVQTRMSVLHSKIHAKIMNE